MKLTTFLIYSAIAILIAIFISCVNTWYHVFLVGQYFNHASFFLTFMVGASPIFGAVILYFCIKGLLHLKKSI